MGNGTPPEEIARQHEEAVLLVKQNMPCADITYKDEIPLSWKQQPTEQLLLEEEEKKDTNDCPCVSSRGHVDISKLVSLVTEGYNEPLNTSTTCSSKTNLWSETNASTTNVAIVRPSHDAWGIKKICLVFSDDFLQDTYELPWWHERPDIRNAVQPILNVLQIQHSQVVRLLLAALPPGVTIPVHHDSGEWVKHTHRVHVPVIVNDVSKVLFQCGLTTETMQRVDCTPGHVFELNNQGKHAVSNCASDHRVHLILDYMNTDCSSLTNVLNRPRRRIQLQRGERLLQTRRSIDRAVDRGSRKTPSFLILGAQKAGTTSLYEYMQQHPLIVRPKRRETHCLDWRWNDSLTTTEEQREWCLKFYHAKELEHHPSILTGDSTPSYLLDSLRVIPRLKRVFPWNVKFLIMLRNPTQRAYSHFKMVTSLDGTPEQIKTRGLEWKNLSFEQVVYSDLERMNECGLIPYWNIEKGVLDQDVFDDFCGSQEELQAWNLYLKDIPMNTGSHSLVSRGMYAVQLRPWFDAFARNDFIVLSLDSLKSKEGVQSTMKQVWKHLGIPNIEVKDDSAKNTREYDKMNDEIGLYLDKFYFIQNHRLAELLGSDWKDVWSR